MLGVLWCFKLVIFCSLSSSFEIDLSYALVWEFDRFNNSTLLFIIWYLSCGGNWITCSLFLCSPTLKFWWNSSKRWFVHFYHQAFLDENIVSKTLRFSWTKMWNISYVVEVRKLFFIMNFDFLPIRWMIDALKLKMN